MLLIAVNANTQAFNQGQPAIKLYKLNEDGSLDTSFGQDGAVAIETIASQSNSFGARFDKDGNIIVSKANTLQRFDQSGEIDLSFGANGVLQLPETVIEDGQSFSVKRSVILF